VCTWNRTQHPLCHDCQAKTLESIPPEILSPFAKRIQRDLDAFPLEKALLWERKRGREKLLDFLLVYTAFGGLFGPSEKH